MGQAGLFRVSSANGQFETLLEDIGEIILSCSLDGSLLYYNRALLSVLEYTGEEMIGVSLFDLIAPEKIAHCRQRLKDIFEGNYHTVETTLLTKQGRRVYLQGRCRPQFGENGVPVAVGAVFRDVTDAKIEMDILESIANGAPQNEVLTRLIAFIELQSDDLIASFLFLDEEEKQLLHGVAPSLPESYTSAVDGLVIGEKVGSCGTAAYSGEQVFVNDIANDPLWDGYQELALSHGLAACWSTPIKSASGAVLGTFAIYRREVGEPSVHHRHLIEVSTHLAGLVLNRERTESQLHVSEEKFATAFRSSPDAIFLTGLDDGILVDVNESACRVSGFARQELIGESTLQVGLWGNLADREKFLSQLRREGRVKDFQAPFRRKSGEIGSALLGAEVLALRNGNFVLTTLSDITELKRTEEELRKNQLRLARAEKIANLGHWSYNVLTEVVHWSEGMFRIFGRLPEEYENLSLNTVQQWLHPDDLPAHDAYFAMMLRQRPGESLPNLEYRLIRPDGEERSVEVVCETEFDNAGSPRRFFGTVLDITDRKRAENAAKQAAVAQAQIVMLTPRERDVLQLVVTGLANKVVARRLEISEKTVEKHRSNLMRKLQVQSVAELVRLALLAEDVIGRDIPR